MRKAFFRNGKDQTHRILAKRLPSWEKIMTISAHLDALQKKHEALELQINSALASPSSDDLDISDMKRKKLQLKDEIEKLKFQANGNMP